MTHGLNFLLTNAALRQPLGSKWVVARRVKKLMRPPLDRIVNPLMADLRSALGQAQFFAGTA